MKNKNQILLLIGLLIVAAMVWVLGTRARSASAGAAASVAQNYSPLSVENPAPHWWKLDATRKTEYRSSGRDLFSEVAAPPPEVSKPTPKPGDPGSMQSGPPPPPPAPQLPGNMKFFGYGTVPVGTARLAFFTDGNDVFIVGEGDVLLGRFRIVKIGNASLEFEEVDTGRRGAATIEDQGMPG